MGFPTFQFHRLSELLIDLLQQVADGQFTRLIVCCPPRHGKSQLVLATANAISSPTLDDSPATRAGESDVPSAAELAAAQPPMA